MLVTKTYKSKKVLLKRTRIKKLVPETCKNKNQVLKLKQIKK